MNSTDTSYEVETRLRFIDKIEFTNLLPSFVPCLTQTEAWSTDFYGLDVFVAGNLLRVVQVTRGNDLRYFLGWKDRDLGKFANIRAEIEEEITYGINNSQILQIICANANHAALGDILTELQAEGYSKFMSFSGYSLSGLYEPLGFKVKLMNCDQLRYPTLLEIEKTTSSIDEALNIERQLEQFVCNANLLDRVVKLEPPALLYSNAISSS